MEKKYKQQLFNVELAKKVFSGEIEGRFRCGYGKNELARVLCLDFNRSIDGKKMPIVAAIPSRKGEEFILYFDESGQAKGDIRILTIETAEE